MYYLLPSSGFTPSSQKDGHSSGRLVLRSILTTAKDPSFLCQGWRNPEKSTGNHTSSKERATFKGPSYTDSVQMWPVPSLCCQTQRDWGAWVVWQSLPSLRTFSFSSSIALLTGSRDRRICLPASFPKHGSVGGCQMPSLWGGVWISPAQS